MRKESIDTKLLMFDPWDSKTVEKLEYYDEFKEDFGIDKSEAVAYIILTYDLKSQLRKEVSYFNQRKVMAAELAGFKKENGKFAKEYEDILVGQNKEVNRAISKYIRLFGSSKYISLVYYWSIQAIEFENITSGTESKDLKNTIANIEKLENKINECTDFLFGGNEVSDIKKSLYESVEKELLKIRPEDIALSENIDDLLENPYNGWKPEQLKYEGHR